MSVIIEAKNRWLVLFVFMIAHGVNDGFLWILPPLLPAIREHFQLSYTEMGAFLTVYRFVGNVFQAPAAYLVHLASIAIVLVSGLLLMSAGMFVASLSPTYAALVWISTAGGVGRSTYHPLAVTILSRIFGRQAFGRAMGLHLSGSQIGMVVAPFIVGLLLSRYSWRLPLQLWSLLGVSAGLMLFLFLRNQQLDLQIRGKSLGWPFFSKPMGIYLLASGTWGIAQSGFMAFLPLFLVDQRGYSTEAAAAVFGIMSFSGAVCRPFLGALMDWMGRRKPVVIGGFLISAISILILINVQTSWMLYGSVGLLGIFGSGHAGLADTFMIEMIPSHRREETLGFIYTLRMGVSSLSPVIVGFVSEQISFYNSFLCLAALGGLAALLISFAAERPVES
ncbi:MAG: MFS transporter [Deltaproteobacteria bacterium]|nr:MFS transporter [Deltaproteobacteria bacterium]